MMVLSAYLARAGVASRRAVVPFIKKGDVVINNNIVTDPAYRVLPSDRVVYQGLPIKSLEKYLYILLNKPKGYITTTSDEKGRKTVMDFFVSANMPRIYPIGRLDRNTSGLLLLTNDGQSAQRLAHPRFEVPKIYVVTLARPFSRSDYQAIKKGVVLKDGLIVVDSIEYQAPHVLTLHMHSGKNRIVRRIFEHCGYEVVALDRIGYAHLTKKNLPVGRWRFLSLDEIKSLVV